MVNYDRAAAQLLCTQMEEDDWGVVCCGIGNLNISDDAFLALFQQFIQFHGLTPKKTSFIKNEIGFTRYANKVDNEIPYKGIVDDYFLSPPLCKIQVTPSNIEPIQETVLSITLNLSRVSSLGLNVEIDSGITNMLNYFDISNAMFWNCQDLQVNSNNSGFSILAKSTEIAIDLPWVRRIDDLNFSFYFRVLDTHVKPDYPNDLAIINVRNQYDLATRSLDDQDIFNGYKYTCYYSSDIDAWILETSYQEGDRIDDLREGLTGDQYAAGLIRLANRLSDVNLEMIPRKTWVAAGEIGKPTTYRHTYTTGTNDSEAFLRYKDAFGTLDGITQWLEDRLGFIYMFLGDEREFLHVGIQARITSTYVQGDIIKIQKFAINPGTDQEWFDYTEKRIGHRWILRKSPTDTIINLPT